MHLSRRLSFAILFALLLSQSFAAMAKKHIPRPRAVWDPRCTFNGPAVCNRSNFVLVKSGGGKGKYREQWELADNPFILFDGAHNAVTTMSNATLLLTYNQVTKTYTYYLSYDYTSNVQDNQDDFRAYMQVEFAEPPKQPNYGEVDAGYVGGPAGRQCGPSPNHSAGGAISPLLNNHPNGIDLLVLMPGYEGHCP
jgi:hypothetical protein